MPESRKQDSWSKITAYWIDSLSTGGTFPLSDFNELGGKVVNVNNRLTNAKYTLIDFWASWCIPCRLEMPLLATVYNKFKGKEFNLISVSVDRDIEAWRSAVKAENFYWEQLHGAPASLYEKFMLRAIPANFLLNADGRIVAKNMSPDQLDSFLAESAKSRKIN